MENVSPTRMNLLYRKAQVQLALQGVDLLKKKRDALVSEFFGVVHNTLESRNRLNAVSQDAVNLLNIASSIEGKALLESAALAGKREVFLNVAEKNIWGIKIPELSISQSLKRKQSQRGYNNITAPARVIKTADNFEEMMDLLIEVAGRETRLKKLGAEIKKATRRVNALEQIVIPGLYNQMAYIKSVLEQRERDDIFRLKLIKNKAE
jgi:V/A-type H+-transporting ATPase subunit D